jgi:hypothetical protein
VAKIDVLTPPVDGSSDVLNYDQVDTVVDRLKPKIVVPKRYFIEGTSLAISILHEATGRTMMNGGCCRARSLPLPARSVIDR